MAPEEEGAMIVIIASPHGKAHNTEGHTYVSALKKLWLIILLIPLSQPLNGYTSPL